ncbi:MAG: MCE family protein [Prevotella sp.]|nr:MCE family protein [Prevotella sp.]
MKGFTKEIKIALVAIVGIVVLFFGMQFLKGVSLFSDDTTYYVSFSNISGLTDSSPIKENGFKVGVVRSIDYDFNQRDKIIAEVGIDKNLRIPKGTVAEISSDLLGNVQVDLVMGDEANGFLKEGDTFEGRLNGGAMGKVKEMVPEIQEMMPKLDAILASINYILADQSIVKTLHNADQLTGNLTQSTKDINFLMADLKNNVPGMVGKADGVLQQAGTAIGSANQVMGNAERLTNNLASLDLQTTLEQLNQTLANLKNVTEQLNSGNGTVAKLLNDREVYDKLDATLTHVDSLMIDLRQHPKRYVHFSVFGKKDKPANP